jgi:hypothetical protein
MEGSQLLSQTILKIELELHTRGDPNILEVSDQTASRGFWSEILTAAKEDTPGLTTRGVFCRWSPVAGCSRSVMCVSGCRGGTRGG